MKLPSPAERIQQLVREIKSATEYGLPRKVMGIKVRSKLIGLRSNSYEIFEKLRFLAYSSEDREILREVRKAYEATFLLNSSKSARSAADLLENVMNCAEISDVDKCKSVLTYFMLYQCVLVEINDVRHPSAKIVLITQQGETILNEDNTIPEKEREELRNIVASVMLEMITGCDPVDINEHAFEMRYAIASSTLFTNKKHFSNVLKDVIEQHQAGIDLENKMLVEPEIAAPSADWN